MIAARIAGTTRVLGKSQGYLGLPVRDSKRDGQPSMTTAWEVTPGEFLKLQDGAHIEITILGNAHPPIIVTVGEVDK